MATVSFRLPLPDSSSNSNYPSLLEDQSKQEKVNLLCSHLRIILGFFLLKVTISCLNTVWLGGLSDLYKHKIPFQINGFCTCLIWNKHSISHVFSFPSVFIIADTQLWLSTTYSGSFNIWTPSSISLTHTCNKRSIWLKITTICSQLNDLLVFFLL